MQGTIEIVARRGLGAVPQFVRERSWPCSVNQPVAENFDETRMGGAGGVRPTVPPKPKPCQRCGRQFLWHSTGLPAT